MLKRAQVLDMLHLHPDKDRGQIEAFVRPKYPQAAIQVPCLTDVTPAASNPEWKDVEIVLTGTGAALPSKYRNGQLSSGLFLSSQPSSLYLFHESSVSFLLFSIASFSPFSASKV